MRDKLKNGKASLFNLSDEEREIIKNLASIQGCSQSDFIGWLVRNYAISKDPIKEMELLDEQENKLQNSILEIKSKKAEVLERMKAHKDNELHRQSTKVQAIRIISRKIREGSDRVELEQISKFWGMRLNIDPVQLLYEATHGVKNEKMSYE